MCIQYREYITHPVPHHTSDIDVVHRHQLAIATDNVLASCKRKLASQLINFESQSKMCIRYREYFTHPVPHPTSDSCLCPSLHHCDSMQHDIQLRSYRSDQTGLATPRYMAEIFARETDLCTLSTGALNRNVQQKEAAETKTYSITEGAKATTTRVSRITREREKIGFNPATVRCCNSSMCSHSYCMSSPGWNINFVCTCYTFVIQAVQVYL